MAKSLIQILGYQNLTEIIQSPASGIPNVLPPSFMTLTKPVEGISATYGKVDGNRKTARIAHYGSPSKRRELKGLSTVPVTLLHTIEHEFHGVNVLNSISQFDNPQAQAMGMNEISRQVADFSKYFTNLRVAAVHAMLFKQMLYFDANGNLLPDSNGATVTVDYGVPAGNKGQLDVFGTGPCISASWAIATTDIPGDIKAVKKAARKKTGYPIRHAFYGENIFGYLINNSNIRELIAGNPGYAQAFLQNEIPQGFLGLNWWPAEEAYFEDDNGVLHDFCDPDQIVFTPDPSPDWYELYEGSYHVPTSLGQVSSDATSAAGAFAKVYGKFSYAKIEDDPCGIKHVAGDTFLPVLKVPAAIFSADVVPDVVAP